ncbi:MAG: aminopeptidase P family N-terminal domain-containing protein, partial [Verrucomicrobiota bacterium]
MLTLPASPRQRHDQKCPVAPAADGLLPVPDFCLRRQRALALARGLHADVDAVIVSDPLDIHYLTGSRHGISWLVLLDGTAFAVSRHMLVSEVRAEALNCEVLLASARSTDQTELEKFVIAEVARRELASVVIDPAKLTAQSYLRLAAHTMATGIDVHCISECIASLRAVKDSTEIA